MFNNDSPKEKEPVDYTGLKIVGILAPVFFLITFLSNADMALAACIVLGTVILAIKIRWHLRKRAWFWAIIGCILALHVPLIRLVRWPQGNVPTLFYTMPLGIADFLIISGALGLAEKFLSKSSSSSGEERRNSVGEKSPITLKVHQSDTGYGSNQWPRNPTANL
jgi:hypothetical protein